MRDIQKGLKHRKWIVKFNSLSEFLVEKEDLDIFLPSNLQPLLSLSALFQCLPPSQVGLWWQVGWDSATWRMETMSSSQEPIAANTSTAC